MAYQQLFTGGLTTLLYILRDQFYAKRCAIQTTSSFCISLTGLAVFSIIFLRRCWYVAKLVCDGPTNNQLQEDFPFLFCVFPSSSR